jgi:hypothetical protein
MRRTVVGFVTMSVVASLVSVAGSSTSASAAPTVSHLLTVTPAEVAAFKSAFIDFKLRHDEMIGTDRFTVARVRSRSGLVRADIAYDAVDHREWAMVAFDLVYPASMKAEISMQDGGNYGVFNRVGSGKWFMLGHPAIPLCYKDFPSAIAQLWGLQSYATCR